MGAKLLGFDEASGTPGDVQLMEAVAGGRLECLGELFERHHRALYAFLLRLTSDPGTAEDLVQEVFLRVLKYRKSFRPGSPFEPWVYTLARNAAIDLHRRRGEAPVEEEALEERPSPAPGVHETVVGRQAAVHLRSAFRALSTEQREVLVLARFEGRPYVDIAARLGCSVGAVKLRVHRAARRLAEIYGNLQQESAT
ncbi:MAG: RNA polymerase sigma factor [Thermoanaerobaculia bacterium]